MGTRLRPVTQADLEMLVAIGTEEEATGEYEWRGFRSPEAIRNRFEQDGFLGETGGMLAVEHSGEAVGVVSWNEVSHGPNAGSRCWGIGIVLLPAWRGKGLGAAAQGMLADYLFETTTKQRIQAGTDIGNLAEQRALERAGFRREGVLRSAQFRAGAWHDMVLYGRLRQDPPGRDIA